MEAFTNAASSLYAQGPQERNSLIKTCMDSESKHNPRGVPTWGKMIFQPHTLSLEDPFAVCSEQAPVSSWASLIRIVKHSQETNKKNPALPSETGREVALVWHTQTETF